MKIFLKKSVFHLNETIEGDIIINKIENFNIKSLKSIDISVILFHN